MVRRARKLLVHAGSYDILQAYKDRNERSATTTIGHTYTDVQPTTNTKDINIINSTSGECISYTDLPYYSGLFVIFEKLSLFPNNRQLSDRFMKHWKDVICKEGFIFVRYESIACGSHRSHGMVFKTNTAEEYLRSNKGESRGILDNIRGEMDVGEAVSEVSDVVLSATTTADSGSDVPVAAVVGEGGGDVGVESSVVGAADVSSDVSAVAAVAASVVELNRGRLFEGGLWTQQDFTDEHRQLLKGGI